MYYWRFFSGRQSHGFFSLDPLIRGILLILILILSKSCIHWINLCWSWFVIFLLYYKILFANILFSTFASIFINNIGLVFSFCTLLIKCSFRNSCSNHKVKCKPATFPSCPVLFYPCKQFLPLPIYPHASQEFARMWVITEAIMNRSDQKPFPENQNTWFKGMLSW